MSDEETTGAEFFMQIFKEEDEKEKGRIARIFMKRFVRSYKIRKHDILMGRNIRGEFGLTRFVTDFEPIPHSISTEENAEILGRRLGRELAVIEAIANPNAAIGGLKARAYFQATAVSLKEANKKIKLKFLQNRIRAIAKKRAGTLSNDKQQLLSDIASYFT